MCVFSVTFPGARCARERECVLFPSPAAARFQTPRSSVTESSDDERPFLRPASLSSQLTPLQQRVLAEWRAASLLPQQELSLWHNGLPMDAFSSIAVDVLDDAPPPRLPAAVHPLRCAPRAQRHRRRASRR